MSDEPTTDSDGTPPPGTPFTGLARARVTPKRVRRAERTAKFFIMLGGMGTIAAVTLIFVFLLWVVVPLFSDAEAERDPAQPIEVSDGAAAIVRCGVDGNQLMGWTLRADGTLEVRRLSTGALLDVNPLFEGQEAPTAIAFATDKVQGEDLPNVAFGFADGTIRSGRIEFLASYLKGDGVPESARSLRPGGSVVHENGVIEMTPRSDHRFARLQAVLNPPVKVADAAIDLLDLSLTPSGAAYAYLARDDTLAISTFVGRHDMMLDETVFDVTQRALVYRADAERGRPAYLRLGGIGTMLFLIWSDGYAERFDARREAQTAGGELQRVETAALFGDGDDATVEALEFLSGKTTFVVADSKGRLHAWFPTRPAGAYARDGIAMARGHLLTPEEGAAAPVTALVASRRSKLLATAHTDGTVRLYHVTTDQHILAVASDKREPILALALAPKEDALVAWSADALQRWQIDPSHPEATFASLFTKVWYEGQIGPTHAWQSEGGSDDFEPKLGLMALIFGTMKATIYSMLIAAPIAILAAIFTSEFLVPRWRAPIKSIIEMMASLPSVVLGFIAAIVLAPFVEGWLMVVLVSLITLPFAVVFGARLWQFLPSRLALRMEGAPRVVAVTATLPAAIVLAMVLAPAIERWCFSGDLLAWLNRGEGDASGGWTFLLLPMCLLAVAVAVAYLGGPWIRNLSSSWSRAQCAWADMARMATIIVGGVLLAWLLGVAFGGMDPRGPSGDALKYQPRNAMIVGFVMGFAIVPIIYTLAEDALASVPKELREGSLGCGATPWQTSWRIVVPTAASGLFGALMVGLGRAVGETMIVLMAAGNTAIMDWMPVNGFRTLSANIATELPEAVQGSTHYRVLFLAGFVLFAMTFAINTVAELVRRHFRKRFADL